MQVLSERQAALVAAAEAEAETAKPDCPLQRAKNFQQIGSGYKYSELQRVRRLLDGKFKPFNKNHGPCGMGEK